MKRDLNLNPRFYPQDDNDIISQDSCNLKGNESQISDSSTGSKNSVKSETNLVKKSCIIRRTTSLYTAVKRIKNNKKSRQTITRRPLKNQCVHNVENNSKLPAMGSKDVKSLLKTTDNLIKSPCFGGIHDATELQIKDFQYSNKKLTTTNKLSKMTLSSEETAIVKHGAKRLKIISTRVNKRRPEVGESSNNVPENTKPSTKTFLAPNKQNTRTASKVIKKRGHNVEQNRSKSSKSKKINRNTIVVENVLKTESSNKIQN